MMNEADDSQATPSTKPALTFVLYFCTLIGSLTVAIVRDLLTWPYRYFGLGFVFRILSTTFLTLGVPFLVAAIAAKGRGIEKRVFLIAWIAINGYIIYDSIQNRQEQFSLFLPISGSTLVGLVSLPASRLQPFREKSQYPIESLFGWMAVLVNKICC